MGEMSDDGRTAAEQPVTVAALQAALAAERARAREIDHRARNSLQLISALLLLLSRSSAHQETRAALDSVRERIGAIAAAHRHLADAGRPDRVDLTGLVREQAEALAGPTGAAMRLQLDALEVDAAVACPLALIASELLQNALSRARADGPAPTARVSLRKAGEGFVLTVEDNARVPPPASTDFGLTLVRLLAQQIAAHFDLEDAQPGLRAVVTKT